MRSFSGDYPLAFMTSGLACLSASLLALRIKRLAPAIVPTVCPEKNARSHVWWLRDRESPANPPHNGIALGAIHSVRAVCLPASEGVGRRVRIRLPPAGSQMRTRPRGFGNLPPCEPRARTASEISSSVRLALACGASVATPRHCAGGVPVDRVARARRSVTSASLI